MGEGLSMLTTMTIMMLLMNAGYDYDYCEVAMPVESSGGRAPPQQQLAV
jgi:hypothetical protein